MTAPSPPPRGASPDLLDDDVLVEALPDLLSLATALTGGPAAGADLVAASLTRRTRPVREALGSDLPLPRLRGLVVQQFLHPRGRRPTGPDGPDGSGGLGGLRPQERAAVVLRDGIGLTSLEIAAVLDRPAPAVISDLERLPDRGSVVSTLMGTAPDPQQVRDRLGSATRGHRRRHRRVGLLLGLAAVLVALAVAVPTVLLPRLPADSRPAGAWRFSHQLEVPSGWTVEQRSITSEVEASVIKPPTAADDPYTCGVSVYVRGAFRPTGPTQATTFRSRPALSSRDADNAYLAWEYGDDAWAQSYCSSLEPGSDVLRQVGNMVRFAAQEVRLPFTLAAVPDGYTITGVTEFPESHLTEVVLERPELGSDDVNLLISGPYANLDVEGTSEQVAGRTWTYAGGVEPRMCTLDAARRAMCVTGTAPLENPNEGTPLRRLAPRQIRSVVTALTLSDDLGEPDRWPTGAQLPRS